jgi:TldD protein
MKLQRFSVHDIPRRRFLELTMKGGVAVAATPALLTHLASCSSGSEAMTVLDTDRDLISRVLKKALEKGGDFSEVYIESRVSKQIVMEESMFRSGLYGISQGAGVRVVCGNKTGYAYTDEITEEKLMRAAEVASYVAANGTPVAVADLKESEYRSFVTVEMPLGNIADEERIEMIRRADQAALSYDPRIKMTMVDYYDEVRGRVIANSEGLYLRDELPLLFFIVQAMSSDGKARHMARERLSMHSGFEMFSGVTPEEVARNAAREAIAMLEAEEAPAGIMDVVMQNGWGGVLVHEAVGQKVASDCFTMIDDGTLANYRGTINHDDEGTPAQRNVLIENGVLLGYMTDILSAKQLSLSRTGNGRRESFRYIPIPRMTNTFIAQGTDNPADILSSTKRGIYVQSLSGGSVNPVTGMFNFTCREAYLIENGKKTRPVRGATLIGSCIDVISNIDAVGNDLAFGPGICGKGQSAEVTAGQPTVRIRGINVGGSKA